jgi:hypothetical protein
MKKNSFLVLGMLAMVLALVFVGCATGTGVGGGGGNDATGSGEGNLPASTITITGLEAHNGKYCWGWGNIDEVNILAGSPGTYWRDDGDNWAPGVFIANGSVTLTLQYWGGDVGEDHPYLVGGKGWLPFTVSDGNFNFGFRVVTSENNLNETGTGVDIQITFNGGMGKGMFKN